MFKFSLAQKHSLYSALEAALVQAGPAVVTLSTAATGHVEACIPGAAGVGIAAGAVCTLPPYVYLAEFAALNIGVRALTGWLSAKHAPEVTEPGIEPGTPTTTTIEAVAVTRPTTPIAPVVLPPGAVAATVAGPIAPPNVVSQWPSPPPVAPVAPVPVPVPPVEVRPAPTPPLAPIAPARYAAVEPEPVTQHTSLFEKVGELANKAKLAIVPPQKKAYVPLQFTKTIE